jgi:protein-disulfide isomerase
MKQQVLIPIAIVAAGLIVAGAVFLVKRPVAPTPGGTAETIRPVDATDYVLGNPDAPIKLIEYSDLECPFCKEFHNTMHTLMDEYGSTGQVAWVYRHFPLTQLHPKAAKEAEAAECAGELGGNDAFWKFIDRVYEVTPSNNGLDLNQLPAIAEEIGLPRAQFEQCLASGKYEDKVDESFDEAVALGGRGTPHTILMVGDSTVPLEGAQPLSAMRSAVAAVLAELQRPTGTPTQ